MVVRRIYTFIGRAIFAIYFINLGQAGLNNADSRSKTMVRHYKNHMVLMEKRFNRSFEFPPIYFVERNSLFFWNLGSWLSIIFGIQTLFGVKFSTFPMILLHFFYIDIYHTPWIYISVEQAINGFSGYVLDVGQLGIALLMFLNFMKEEEPKYRAYSETNIRFKEDDNPTIIKRTAKTVNK